MPFSIRPSLTWIRNSLRGRPTTSGLPNNHFFLPENFKITNHQQSHKRVMELLILCTFLVQHVAHSGKRTKWNQSFSYWITNTFRDTRMAASRLLYDSTRNGLGIGKGGCFSPFLSLGSKGGVSFHIYCVPISSQSKRYLSLSLLFSQSERLSSENDGSSQLGNVMPAHQPQVYISLLKIWLTFSISLLNSVTDIKR